MLTFAHWSDAHLDQSATCGGKIVRGSDGVNIRWRDRVRCLEAACQGAIEAGCALAIDAGDLFDTYKPTPAEYEAALRCYVALSEHMPVIVCGDNHGLGQSVEDRHAVCPLAGVSPNLFVLTRPELLTLDVARVGKVRVGVLPYPRRSALRAIQAYHDLGAEATNAAIAERLRRILRGWRATLDPTEPALLVAHLQVVGASLASGAVGEDMLALRPEDLEGWDYVALGDNHRRQAFGLPATAWYSGSLDRIDFGEEVNEPGWNLVRLEPNDEGRVLPAVTVHYTPARLFWTMGPKEAAGSGPVGGGDGPEHWPIVRVRGRVTPEEYDALRPALAHWRELPTFTEALEIVRETRARDESMTVDVTDEDALRMWAMAQHAGLEEAGEGGETSFAEALVQRHRALIV